LLKYRRYTGRSFMLLIFFAMGISFRGQSPPREHERKAVFLVPSGDVG
jgi:hypothetical protein